MSNLGKAIQSLRPNAIWVLSGNEYSGIDWLDTEQTKPTKIELNAEMARLEAEEAANAYKALRASEYPPITDYLDGIVKGDQDQVDKYIADCLAVKAKYPK